MSNLIHVPKNGSLSSTNSNLNFPSWSNLIDDVFNKDLPKVFTSTFDAENSFPKVNIKENVDLFTVEMAVPGFKKSDFQIEIDNQMVSISTELNKQDERLQEHYTLVEFKYTSFKRTFNLPETVDDEKITASYKDGILSVFLPKKEEAKQKPLRQIKIS